MTSDEKLLKLLKKLEENGVDTNEILHLEAAIQTTKKPMHKRAIEILKANWKRVKGEISESKRLTMLLKKSQVEGSSSLTTDEKKFVQEQLIDFFRIFPASLIAGVNAVLPIPGTGLLTPLILKKLGLLPSRWREANMLQTLQNTHLKLRSSGDTETLKLMEELQQDLDNEVEQRKVCDLLVVWDANRNGIWDENEKITYQNELIRTLPYVQTFAKERSWFILHDGLVFGPSEFGNIPKDIPSILVRFKDQTKWVDLRDLLHEAKSHN